MRSVLNIVRNEKTVTDFGIESTVWQVVGFVDGRLEQTFFLNKRGHVMWGEGEVCLDWCY